MLLRGPFKRVFANRNPTTIPGGLTAAGGGIRSVAKQVLRASFSTTRAFALMQTSLRRVAILTGTSGSIFASAAWFAWPSQQQQVQPYATAAGTTEESPATTGETKLKISTGSSQIAHPSKRAKGGEDAFFISKDGRALGVFDGVGGWTESGVDPRLYAVKLAEGCERLANSADLNTVTPIQIMDAGYKNAFDTMGSSTACVAVVREDGTLHTANVGDSGYVIIRDSKLFFKSPEQQHGFNFPYQLGCRGHPADTPQRAATEKHEVKTGDIVVLATDGFFDNVFPEEVVTIVNTEVSKSEIIDPSLPSTLATSLAQRAFASSQNERKNGPFALNARKAGYRFDGGKPDDITVVVGIVSQTGKSKL